ncbi:hypothetical protein GW17_00055235 [Ensete ventricosum]|nr:hypothetical protein GW17_00055235 [Ensete ventricosum]
MALEFGAKIQTYVKNPGTGNSPAGADDAVVESCSKVQGRPAIVGPLVGAAGYSAALVGTVSGAYRKGQSPMDKAAGPQRAAPAATAAANRGNARPQGVPLEGSNARPWARAAVACVGAAAVTTTTARARQLGLGFLFFWQRTILPLRI